MKRCYSFSTASVSNTLENKTFFIQKFNLIHAPGKCVFFLPGKFVKSGKSDQVLYEDWAWMNDFGGLLYTSTRDFGLGYTRDEEKQFREFFFNR